MTTLPLLCTAEAFGFGPAAALYQLLPHLRDAGCDAIYMGTGWTLEMHKAGMYREVHDVDVRSDAGRARFCEALRRTPAMLSVCDLQAVELGVQTGAATVLYDVLAWFRHPAPELYQHVGTLVCPDFFGVREALVAADVPRALVVPPLMPQERDEAARDDTVVVNLGGLQTPYNKLEACVRYAQHMVDAVTDAWGPPVVLTSRAVGEHLQHCDVRTVGPAQARELVARARCAFLTGGIGNIMDAAGLAAPVCFMPPMSQSQGQQLALLREHVPFVPTIAWRHIALADPINYHASHTEVMPDIASRIDAASTPLGARRLRACIRDVRDALNRPDAGRGMHDAFLQRFGRDDGSAGAAAIAAALVQGGSAARSRVSV